MDIDHLCKQKDCVNPDHLEPVPHVENLRRGPRTILNWDKVREIRRLSAAKTHTQRQLAEMFGISDTQVGAIIHNQYWRE
jgi:DNA gyrase/topoisomerase IV subunit A